VTTTSGPDAATPLVAAAVAGDAEAFRRLTDPHRRELTVHCYRMLGSLDDAEDAVQETLLKAWRRLDSFEGRSSVRAWLYRIATNVCLDLLDHRARRVLPAAIASAADPAVPPALAVYAPTAGQARTPFAVKVFTVDGDLIGAITGFVAPHLFTAFDLPDRYR